MFLSIQDAIHSMSCILAVDEIIHVIDVLKICQALEDLESSALISLSFTYLYV